MPLVSVSKVHRSFPPHFAEGFTQHVRRRNETAQHAQGTGHRREQLKKKQTEDMVFSSSEDTTTAIKRPRTPTKGLETATTGPQNVTVGPKNVTVGPKNVIVGPTTVTAGPRNVPVGPKRVTAGPRNVTAGLKTVTEGPCTVTEGLYTASMGPPTATSGPNIVIEGSGKMEEMEEMDICTSPTDTHRGCYRSQSGQYHTSQSNTNGHRDCHRLQNGHSINNKGFSEKSSSQGKSKTFGDGHRRYNTEQSFHNSYRNTCNNNNNTLNTVKDVQNANNIHDLHSNVYKLHDIHSNNNNKNSHRECSKTCRSTMDQSDPLHDNSILTNQAWWAVRPKSRDSHCCDGESRATLSLESVDLWESDTEDSSEVNEKDGFDRINGVLINPRKTFDFSDLRRSKGHVIKEDHVTRPRSRRHVREADKRAGKMEKCRLLEEKSNLEEDKTCLGVNHCRLGEEKMDSGERKQTVAERLQYLKAKQKENELKQKALEASNKQLQRLEHQLRQQHQQQHLKQQQQQPEQQQKQPEKQQRQQQKPHKGILSPPKTYDSKSDCTKTSDKMDSTLNSRLAAGFVSKLKPRVKLVPGLHTQQEMPRRRDVTSSAVFVTSQAESKMASVEELASATYPLRGHQGSTRRVKFNQVVSVRDGERNLKDELRTSKNSAQLFKQKYLLGISRKEEAIMEERPLTPTPDSGFYVQLAY